MKVYPELKCSACGYIPDQEDIEKTNYTLEKCETCGKEKVCDLCLFYSFVKGDITDDDFEKKLGKTRCPACTPDRDASQCGKERKFWLQEEY